jgi:hypothetical protein
LPTSAFSLRSIARRHGARVRRVAFAKGLPTRTLVAVATENAVEGCVRELFAAAVVLHQSERATVPRVRRTVARIARDETRHAALALRIFAWAASRMDARARVEVAHALGRAVRQMLEAPPAARTSTELLELGLPHPLASRALADGLERDVWRALSRKLVGAAPT